MNNNDNTTQPKKVDDKDDKPKEAKKWRWRSKFVHLVYKSHIDIVAIQSLFDSKIFKNKEGKMYNMKVAHETADEEHPYLHTHILLHILQSPDWNNSRRLDFCGSDGMIHPCWLVVYGAEHWKNLFKYLEKENCILDELNGEEYPEGQSELINRIQSHKTWNDVVNDATISSQICRIMKWTREVYNARPKENQSKDIVLWDWQEKCNKLIEEQDEGQILWIYDRVGGMGKSVLTDWLIDIKNAFFCSGGKFGDIAYAFDNQEIAVFDLPRSSEEFTPYRAMEALKDGRFFSGKYNSCMKRFKKVNVVVFANFLPELEKLSKRRWVIKELIKDECNGTDKIEMKDKDFNCISEYLE